MVLWWCSDDALMVLWLAGSPRIVEAFYARARWRGELLVRVRRRTNRQAGRQAGGRAGGRTDRQTDRQTDGQTDRHSGGDGSDALGMGPR
jgi:hypothetical protein